MSHYINAWLPPPPEENWQKFDRTEVLLEAGTRAEAEKMLQFSKDDDTREEAKSKLKKWLYCFGF